MVKTFREWDVDQSVLFLPNVMDLAPEGHVALDGTKMRANASWHKAMSYGRMKKAETEIARQVDQWLEEAEEIDRLEDEQYGADRRGDELPDWVADKQKRLEKIRQAKAELEAKARAEDEQKPSPKYRGGRKPKTPPRTPPDKAQKNFTDPETGQRYTVKRYNSEKAKKGDSWRHEKNTIQPVYLDFAPIVLTGAAEREFQVIADLVAVLERKASFGGD